MKSKTWKPFMRMLSLVLVISFCICQIPVGAVSISATDAAEAEKPTAEATIVAEDISKREESVKHFRMSDGTYRAVKYDTPVHFMQDEVWVDYDNTLTEVDATEETEGGTSKNKDLKNTFADYSVRLSKKTNGHKFVRVEKDGQQLSWYYLDAEKSTAQVTAYTDDNDETTLEKVTSRVVYEDVYKNVDFEYVISPIGVKENIILKKKNAPTVFTAEYKANGLTPVLINDTTIELVDSDNRVVYTLSAPYMIDANGATSTAVTLSLSSVKNNAFTVITTVDEAWLSAKDRAFPVTVDPILQTEQTYGESESAFVGDANKTLCHSNQSGGIDSASLYVGKMAGYGMTESYLKVNNLPTLSVADTVVNAQVSLYLRTCELGLRMDVHRVKTPWDCDSVTWNTKPTKDDMILDYKMLEAGDQGWIFFEITDLVRSWYSGENANYGIALSTQKTSASKAFMYSSRIRESDHPGCRPVLYVDYRNMSGYEDYWSYTGVEAGRDGSASVNNYNGNFIFSQPITLDNGGNLMPVSLSLVYNSNGQTADCTYMAKNVQTNFHLFVRYSPDTAGLGYKYYFNDADGTQHYFWFEGDSITGGKDEDGLGYTFDVIDLGSDSVCPDARFRIIDKDKTKMYFNKFGNVIQIINQNGLSVTVQYDTTPVTRIKSVTDGAGRVYMFGYNPFYPNLCTSITDPANRETSFQYAQGLLKGITFPDSKSIVIGYDNYELSSITAIDGTKAMIEYDATAQKRVKTLSWGFDTDQLEKYAFAYHQNETSVTDKQGRKYTYQFNNYGQTTGIVSHADGRAQYFEYAPGSSNTPTANKLLSQSKVINTVTNHVVNPGFTRDLGTAYTTHISDTTGSSYIRFHNDGNFTQRSIEIYKPAEDTGYALVRQNVKTLDAGTYTFSGYLFAYNPPSMVGNVYFGISIYRDDGAYLRYYSEESAHKRGAWDRKELTFQLNDGEYAQLVIGLWGSGSGGIVWFDDLQIERGASASSCNLVENNNYENGTTAWENGTVSHYANLNGLPRSLWIEGKTNPENKWNTIRQYIVTDEGKKGDVYSFGAWTKADSAPLDNGTKTGDSCLPEFYVGLHFYDAAGTWLQTEYINVNEDVNTWQFVAGEAVAKQNYAKIRIDLVYNNNVNYAYITGAFCYREQFGQTYTYDNDGNVVSSVDLTTSQSNFAHQNNKLATMLNPSGSEYIYSYHITTGNLSFATSTDGVQYSFTYDDKGNPTNATVKQKKLVTSIATNTAYVIQNKYSGNVIDGYGENNSTIVNFSDYGNNAYQKWQFQKAYGSEDEYYIYNSHIGGWLMVENTSNANNAKLIYGFSGDGDRFRFKLVKNDDGTFTITTKASGYTKCIDGMPGDTTDCSNDTPIRQYEKAENDAGQRWYIFEVPNDSKYISTSATYTQNQNFVSTTTDQYGGTASYNYNQTTGTLTSVTAPNQTTTGYTYYDNSNQLKTVQASVSGNVLMTNTYDYHANDQLHSITVNGGTVYRFGYDSFGRPERVFIGDDDSYRELSGTQYNAAGLVKKQTYANGDEVNYVYDTLDRLTEKVYTGTTTGKVQYRYGSNGALTQIIDYTADTHTKYVYDLSGRLVGTREYAGTALTGNTLLSSVSYTYADKTNYLTAVTFTSPLGTQTLSYRYGNIANGEMPDAVYAVKWNGTEKIAYTYDELGRLSAKTVNGSDNTYSYLNVDGSKTTTLIGSLQNALGTYTYTYDASGNITSIKLGDTLLQSYAYDALGQLVRENDAEAQATYTYEYVNGNIVSKKRYTYTEPSQPLGAVQETTTWTYAADGWRDLLTNWNGQAIAYDGIGNPLSIGNKTLSWLGRQLLSLTDGTETVSFAYNADGQRIRKVIADSADGSTLTTEYYYIGSMLAGEKRGNDTILYMNDANGDVYGFTYNGTPYYYVKNTQNDVLAIVDANNDFVVRYAYDAWGNLVTLIDTSSNNIGTINPIRYRSYYYDAETEWYYLSSRYYDSEMCRFVNADTTDVLNVAPTGVTDKNLFAYCDNNPVVRIDRGGQVWETGFDIVTLCVSIVEVCINPKDPWAWAGLVGDVVDLVPFLTGVGEVTRGVKTTVKVVDKATDVVDAAKTIYKTADAASDIRKATGSYEILYKSGKNYIGKGGFKRAITSATRNATMYGDEVTSIMWKSAQNSRLAFIDEYLMQKRFGGVLSSNKELLTYNKIWSPGRRYFGD